MDSEKLKQIFDAIKTDDLKSFSSFMLSKNDLNICFGRFPLLSLCYLYKSYKIIDEYEVDLISVKNYTVVDEYYEIYLEFKKYAKKSIRLYLNKQIISPLEMLSIIDDREKIAKNYQKHQKNDEITSKIKKIYSLTYQTEVISTKDEFVAPKKKKDFKTNLFLSIVAFVMCFMMIFPILSVVIMRSNFGIGTASSPIHISTEKEFVTALSKGKKYYILENDIELTQNITVDKFSGTLNGNGKTLFLGSNLKNSLIQNLTGTVENLDIEINYNDLKISNNLAFLAQISTGIIKNCEIYGSLKGEFINTGDAYLSIFTGTNGGIIENSVSSVSAEFINSTEKNSFLSAFSGTNNGKIISCKSTSLSFVVETVDSACFAIDNIGTIEKCENNLLINQTSEKLWHPNTAGIAINNVGTIIETINNGDITSSSTNELLSNELNTKFVCYAAGISVSNAGTIKDSINNGNILSATLCSETYASGIVVSNNKELLNLKNNGEVYAESQKADVYSSGIACLNSFTYETTAIYFSFVNISSIDSCENNGIIKVKSTGEETTNTLFAGGIVGFNYTTINRSNNNGNIICDSFSSAIFAGGVVAYSGYSSTFSSYLNPTISNSISKCSISACSNLKEATIGGLCGYNIKAKISKSGFEGSISSNAIQTYAGGLSGCAAVCEISSSYASVSFTDENAALSTSYMAMLVGYYQTYGNLIYSSGNAYVENGEYYAMYVDGSTAGTLMGLPAENSGASVFGTLESLKSYLNWEGDNA